VLTRHGWLTGGGAVALVVAGRVFGIVELLLIGVGLATLVLAAVVMVLLARLRIEVHRVLQPQRVHAGAAAQVELEVTNTGNRRTPLLTLRDPVGRNQTATVLLAPLDEGERVRASYRLPSAHRGILDVGPLTVTVGDPFGLAQSTFAAASVVELTVWPAVESVPPLPHTLGDDPHGGSEHVTSLRSSGGDFHALRPYVVGDDLRRVHWPSTARRDELMVRQDELPWQGRATVVLDTRRRAHTADTFERAVSAAGSIVLASSQKGHLVRLVTTDGLDTGMGEGGAHVAVIMEQLAMVEPRERDGLAAVASSLRRAGGAGAVALLLGGADATTTTTSAGVRLRAAATVRFTPDDTVPFPTAWATALAAGRRRALR
jgi:uncharacterized protein (DUF58 family)